jgi:hypothetical protein
LRTVYLHWCVEDWSNLRQSLDQVFTADYSRIGSNAYGPTPFGLVHHTIDSFFEMQILLPQTLQRVSLDFTILDSTEHTNEVLAEVTEVFTIQDTQKELRMQQLHLWKFNEFTRKPKLLFVYPINSVDIIESLAYDSEITVDEFEAALTSGNIKRAQQTFAVDAVLQVDCASDIALRGTYNRKDLHRFFEVCY